MTRDLQEQKLLYLQELKRRQNLPLNKYTPDDTPDRPQLDFHKSDAFIRCALGGNRSGKSVVNAFEVSCCALGKPVYNDWHAPRKHGRQIYVLSAEYRTLYQGIYRHLDPNQDGMQFLPKEKIKRYGANIPGATVPLPAYLEVYHGDPPVRNGQIVPKTEWPYSTIHFISAEGGEAARRKIQAAALDLLAIDEEITGDIWHEGLVRLLDKGGRAIISATLIRSDEWLLDLEDRFEQGDKDVFIVRLNTASNKHLDESTKSAVFKHLSQEEQDVRVKGLSRRKYGLVYPQFNNELHVIDPVDLPDRLERVSALDPGLKVFAGLWAAVDEDSTIYIYDELYEKNSHLNSVAKLIANKEGYQLDEIGSSHYKRIPQPEIKQHDILHLIDPAETRRLLNGDMGIAAQLTTMYNTPVVPADNEILSGVEAVRRVLEINPKTGKPYLQVFSYCTNLIWEIRKYKLKQDKSKSNINSPKIDPVKRDDHACDCLRYLVSYILRHDFRTIPEQQKRITSFRDKIKKQLNRPVADPVLGEYV